MATIIEIKKELNSINKIAKITNAMKVVAISRISRAKRRFLEIIELNNALCQTCALVLKELTTIDDHIKAKNPNTLWIIFTSSLGMAGAYNLNILKKVIGEIKSDDGVIVFGEKGFKFLNKNLKPEQILKYFNLSEKPEDFIYMKYIAKYVYNLYRQGKFSSVKAVYTKFKNMSYFLPINLTIFPLDFNAFTNFNTQKQQIPCFLIEPNPLSAYRHIVNLYVETILYSLFLESKLCEHLSRKSAMIEASDNEDKKINDLNIAYNKKRQEKITSEVSLLAMTL